MKCLMRLVGRVTFILSTAYSLATMFEGRRASGRDDRKMPGAKAGLLAFIAPIALLNGISGAAGGQLWCPRLSPVMADAGSVMDMPADGIP
ncbi:hypothetical protein Dd703_3461 [Musicola paradisiaca Ech703]|uniref:Uncharacterized protein n=1 Tax=Musicola paradisiaca (strain Ech703) TaxID=579405 RepID=C6C3C3_MUSP7|nr:hypothetical protein Dd703_3461 [Musicola paradisiaca Ech703]